VETVIVFDMDGVLAEVSESYREAIVRTVESFTGKEVSHDVIQKYKNAGGWNNDWALAQRLAADLGVQAPYAEVVARFNQIFLGRNGDGLIARERWLPQPGLLERLAGRFGLALFTGRLWYELEITLKRFAPQTRFDPLICADHVARPKPAPDGLLAIRRQKPGHRMIYVGDTVDDARCARSAGVPFLGVAAAAQLRREELVRRFEEEQAARVIESVNQIEAALEALA
jgi:HAD superfamily phosphatase